MEENKELYIGKRFKTSTQSNGHYTYELIPKSYKGPWDLPQGTVLKIVKLPKEK